MPRTQHVIDKIIYGNEQFILAGGGGSGGGLNYQAGTGLSLNGIIFNHSNSITAQNSQAIYPIKIDAQGHISEYGTAVVPLTASSTLDATKITGTIPVASYSNDKVTQVHNSTNEDYRILFSTSATNDQQTNTIKKSQNLTYNPSVSTLKIAQIGASSSNIQIGNSTDSTQYYSNMGSQWLWIHDKTTPAHTALSPNSLYIGMDAGSANSATTYSRLTNNVLIFRENSTNHNFNAAGVDKVNALCSTVTASVGASTDLSAATWTSLISIPISVAGTYLLVCSGQFPSTTTDAATRLLRLCTTNTGNTSVSGRITEATMRGHGNSQNHCSFTYIAQVTTSTTYYLRGWSSIAASGCYGAYQLVRLI